MKWMVMPLCILLSSCGRYESIPVRIAINPWPGYEFLYLADRKGIFEEVGLDIELVELASLADVQRTYVQGRVDGMASTMIEVVHAVGEAQEPLTIVLLPDYSNGGDVVVSRSDIAQLSDLKGKVVSAELGSLGMFMLHLGLERVDLRLSDVKLDNSEQLEIQSLFESRDIDAAVSYPPFSTLILRDPNYHIIFDSSQIPEQVIDVISVKSAVVEQDPEWVSRFHQAWGKALEFARTNPQEAYQIMAEREGISVAEFEDALSGLSLVGESDQRVVLSGDGLLENAQKVCFVLSSNQPLNFECSDIEQKIRVPDL
ncbi:ABC transporter substrate-binding protein [Vibrio makurazakiensis]|uniref:ABC transporter substrate-binding protein n=1 Tax=Vibrio makurazakiensis TaxID=2910250 RepID=UPI003D141DF9